MFTTTVEFNGYSSGISGLRILTKLYVHNYITICNHMAGYHRPGLVTNGIHVRTLLTTFTYCQTTK